MSKMVSMKGTGDAGLDAPMSSTKGDDYPWGLRLHLESAQLEALGIEMMPDPGSKRMLLAKVEIVSTDSRNDEQGTQRSMSLQITDMQLMDDAGDSPADRLYGNGLQD